MSDIVICSNPQCGQEYHSDFAKCPFCGTENPQIDILNKKLEQQRSNIAQRLEKEKLLEDVSGGAFQSSLRLFTEGGYVDSPKEKIWKKIPVYAYCIAFLSFAGFIIVLTLSLIPNYDKHTEWLNCGWVTSIAGMLTFIGIVLSCYNSNQGYYVKPLDNKTPFVGSDNKNNKMGTYNNFGTLFIGDFRQVASTHVSYFFVSFFLPIFPIGCYRVTKGATTGTSRRQTTQYKIHGSEKWKFLEVLGIYLIYYGGMTLLVGLVWLLTLIF